MASIPTTYNLLIKQGASFALDLKILQQPEIEIATDAEAGATSLSIKPLEQALGDGQKLYCPTTKETLSLSANAAFGAQTLAVSAIAIRLPRRTKLYAVADLTGCTARSQFKGKLTTATSPNTFTVAFGSPRTDGNVKLTLTAAQTATVPANLAFGQFISEAELQARTAQTNDYFWELEVIYPDGTIESNPQGLIVVYPEKTTVSV